MHDGHDESEPVPEGVNQVGRSVIDALASIHTAQLLTYLRFSGLRLGYLINFNTVRLKDGFRRLVL